MTPEPIETAAAPGGPMHDGREVLAYGPSEWAFYGGDGYSESPPAWRVVKWDPTHRYDDGGNAIGAWVTRTSNPYLDTMRPTLWCELPAAACPMRRPPTWELWEYGARVPGWTWRGGVVATPLVLPLLLERFQRRRFQLRERDGAIVYDSASPDEAIGEPRARQSED